MTSASAPALRARLDDLVAGTTLQFGRFAREIRAERPGRCGPGSPGSSRPPGRSRLVGDSYGLYGDLPHRQHGAHQAGVR